MSYFSVKDLQDIAVQVTSDFYNHNVSLSQGLAKQATFRELNPDQLKRAVEATNTLAYLKSVEGSDRTSEFPLADYQEIMKIASLPDICNSIEKTASIIEVSGDVEIKEDRAIDFLSTLLPQEKLLFLTKEASINRRALDDAKARAFHLTLDLEKAAHELSKTPFAVEGLSLAAKDVQFTKLARLTFGAENTPSRIDWVEDVKLNRDWKPAMQKAAALSDMLNLAQETVAEIEHRTGLDKQAGLITNMAASVARKATSVLTSPFKYAGNKVAAGFSAGVDTAATKIQTGFAGTTMGKNMGVQPGVLKPSTVKTLASSKRTLAAGTLLGGAGLDAVSFKPHNDPSKNQGGDVWDALN